MTDRDVSERKWGRYEILYQGPTENGYLKVKRLILNPLSSTSMQRHKFREEHFFRLLGEAVVQLADRRMMVADGAFVARGAWHSIVNETEKPASLIAVQIGSVVSEDDIERADSGGIQVPDSDDLIINPWVPTDELRKIDKHRKP